MNIKMPAIDAQTGVIQEPVSQNITTYDQLATLIQKRQAFEREHPQAPYTTHPTDINYRDIQGYALIHYAAMMGDLDKVVDCLQQPNAQIDLFTGYSEDHGVSAIVLAMRSGHLAVVEYLYAQGANCEKLYLTDCLDKTAKQWLQSKLKRVYSRGISADSSTAENVFFKATEQSTADSKILLNPLFRAVELNDKCFIESFLQQHVPHEKLTLQKTQLLIVAARNDQTDLVRWLVECMAVPLTLEEYSETPLGEAIRFNCKKTANYLIWYGHGINRPDQTKMTPLLCAVVSENKYMVQKLLKHGAHMNGADLEGNNIYHLLAYRGNVAIAKIILNEMSEDVRNYLFFAKNIYSYTPLDIAKQYKCSPEFLRLFCSKQEAAAIEQSEDYGIVPMDISQGVVMNKMFYYLQSNYRDKTFFEPLGHCAALSFLYTLHEEDYFFSTLYLMAQWDGSEAMLQQAFTDDMPQAKYYKNLEELFERWMNDILGFQNGADIFTIDWAVDSRGRGASYYNLVRDLQQRPYLSIYKASYIERSMSQIEEILHYLACILGQVRINFSYAHHATVAKKQQQGILGYYDPNAQQRIINSRNSRIFESFVDQHCIRLNEFKQTLLCSFTVFTFACESDWQNTMQAEIISEDKLPNTAREHDAFVRNSPNRYTPLHVAVLTQSVTTMKKILDQKFCDIRQVDCSGSTALDIAIANNFYAGVALITSCKKFDPLFISLAMLNDAIVLGFSKIVNLIFNCPHLDSEIISDLAFVYYQNNDHILLGQLLALCIGKNLYLLLRAAIAARNVRFAKQLLRDYSLHKKYKNELLLDAMQLNDNALLESFLAKGACFDTVVCVRYSQNEYTAIELVISYPYLKELQQFCLDVILKDDIEWLKKIFSAKKYVTIDFQGLLSYALEYGAVQCFEFLLTHGIDPWTYDSLEIFFSEENEIFYRLILTNFATHINNLDIQGNGLIHYAAKLQCANKIAELLELNAVAWLQNAVGDTPLSLLKQVKQKESACSFFKNNITELIDCMRLLRNANPFDLSWDVDQQLLAGCLPLLSY